MDFFSNWQHVICKGCFFFYGVFSEKNVIFRRKYNSEIHNFLHFGFFLLNKKYTMGISMDYVSISFKKYILRAYNK